MSLRLVGVLALASSLLVLLAKAAPAAQIEGVTFADRHEARGTMLHLKCVGLLRYMVLIKGYVAALYLGDGVSAADVLTDVPKRLEIDYFHSIKGQQFGEASEQVLARNFDATALARVRSKLAKLNALYEDVQPGDRYALTYIPGIGTELSLNGAAKGLIEGVDFAAMVFSIWLGSDPIDASLKSQLLACS